MSASFLSWTSFCSWIGARRVSAEQHCDDHVVLFFDDGAVARLVSEKTEATPGFSEYTPGSDGHLTTPTVTVFDTIFDMNEYDRQMRAGR
jgi:hypothetical protein